MKMMQILCLVLMCAQFSVAQPVKEQLRLRDNMTIMVLPHNPYQIDALQQLENNDGYKEALLVISGALVDMGYTNTLDLQTFLDKGKKWSNMTDDNVFVDKVKLFIQDAPADIVIDTEILWNDPEGNPQDRQVTLHLKAIDKYNSDIYATNISIRSAKRAYAFMIMPITGNIKLKESRTHILNSPFVCPL